MMPVSMIASHIPNQREAGPSITLGVSELCGDQTWQQIFKLTIYMTCKRYYKCPNDPRLEQCSPSLDKRPTTHLPVAIHNSSLQCQTPEVSKIHILVSQTKLFRYAAYRGGQNIPGDLNRKRLPPGTSL